MYLYFDKQGILKEFINDEALRQGNANVNTIYAYFESEVVTGGVSNLVAVAGEMQINDGAVQTLSTWNVENGTIPYNAERDLYFFKYGVTYRFHKHVLGSNGETLSNGTAALTISAYNSLSPTVVVAAQGLVTFNIQSSVVLADVFLSESDLAYWVGLLSSKEDAVNKVTNFTNIDDTHFPTTEAVSEYVEDQREIIYITTASTLADIKAILDAGNIPVLQTTEILNTYYEYLVLKSLSVYRFARVDKDMVYWHQAQLSGLSTLWTSGSYNVVDARKVVITSSSGTLSQDDYNLLANYEDTLLIQKRADNDWIYFLRASNTNISSLVYWSARIVLAQSNGEVTIGQYLFSVNNSTKAYSVSLTTQTTYSKSQMDTLLSEKASATDVNTIKNNYLISSSVVGDTLTITGKSSGNNTTTTFDVSHKLNKNFSGENVLPDSIGENDYFIINVSGVPYKVSWQTIYNQLGVGGLTEHFKGTYNSLTALETAYPTAEAGDYAYIATPDSEDSTKVILTMAIWDDNDEEWQVQDTSLFVTISAFNDALNEKQDVIDNNNKLESDLVDDTSQTHKFVTQAMYDYLDNQLYQAPSIDLFQLYYNGQPATTPLESGSSGIVNQIRHREKNIDNISTLTFEGQSITPSATATIVNLTTPITITSTITKTLNGVNTKNGTFSSSATISVLTYAYYKATSSTTTPTSDLTKGAQISTLPAQFDVSYASGDYIYFYHTSSGKIIQQYVLGQWTTITSTSLGSVTITKVNGTTQTYYAYRVGPFNASGTDTFRIA